MYKNDFIKYYDDKIWNDLKIQQNLLDTAIKSGLTDDWRNFKKFKNNLLKIIKTKKANFLKDKINNTNEKWKLLKKLKEESTIKTPQMLKYLNFCYTDSKMLANISNNYFIEKIKSIRRKFIPSENDSIEIFKNLKPRNENSFKIPFITINETKNFIKELKSSNSTGYDNINSKFLKKILTLFHLIWHIW